MASAMLKSLSRSHSRGSVVRLLRTLTSRLRLWIIQPHHKHNMFVSAVRRDNALSVIWRIFCTCLVTKPTIASFVIWLFIFMRIIPAASDKFMSFYDKYKMFKDISSALHHLLLSHKLFFLSGDDSVVRRVLKNESPHVKPTDLLASDQYRFSTHHQKLTRMYFEFNSAQVLQLYKHSDS